MTCRLAVAVLLAACLVSKATADTCQYTVKAGDYMYAIAMYFGTSLDNLKALNPGIDYENIEIGQIINAPCMDPDACYYIVQSGDSFDKIAPSFGATTEEIVALNPDVVPEELQIKQWVQVPCLGYCNHTVAAGQRAKEIASAYKITGRILRDLNPSVDIKNLAADQTILVPCTCGYSVKFGDKLNLISTSYDMRGQELQVLNPGLNNAGLTPGKVIEVSCTKPGSAWKY